MTTKKKITCNLWFFIKGWPKAGWLLILTQSTMYPDVVYGNHQNQKNKTLLNMKIKLNYQ